MAIIPDLLRSLIRPLGHAFTRGRTTWFARAKTLVLLCRAKSEVIRFPDPQSGESREHGQGRRRHSGSAPNAVGPDRSATRAAGLPRGPAPTPPLLGTGGAGRHARRRDRSAADRGPRPGAGPGLARGATRGMSRLRG